MSSKLITDGKYSYVEAGEGQPIIVLHGLMGALSNFDGVLNYFSEKGYKVILLFFWLQDVKLTHLGNLNY